MAGNCGKRDGEGRKRRKGEWINGDVGGKVKEEDGKEKTPDEGR